MMNPSAFGWIDKYFTEVSGELPASIQSEQQFYFHTRETGFIYGHIITIGSRKPLSTKGWTSEELSKVALLTVLYNLYQTTTGDTKPKTFISRAVSFYKGILPNGFNILRKVLPGNSASADLEGMIDERVQTNDNIVTKNFSHIVTNALLFQDVLAFRQFLMHGELPPNYLKKLEETIVSVVASALQTKNIKTEYDKLLIKLFEASVRYTKFSSSSIEIPSYEYFTDELEKYYLADMAVLALWADDSIEEGEIAYVHKLGESLQISRNFIASCIVETDRFIRRYKKDIPYFNYSNPVKHFYDQATQTVTLLISRNKTRLIRELANNGELMKLLTHSTHRPLEDKEKKKIKKQLLEVCKTIPSLTIFLLPGGSLLLPILIKFIPKLLPSAFNENLGD